MCGRRLVLAGSLAVAVLVALVGLVVASPAPQATPASVAAGGKLYDTWWKAAPGATEPKGDHPLWSSQDTNKRTGLDTWRCKECHGWDYLGKDGAYGSGSHKTGFVGVFEAGKGKTADQLVAILKGASNPKHDFSAQLDNTSLANLAAFLKEGLIDDRVLVDYGTKTGKNANVDHGQQLFGGTCAACHGADGTRINFGTEKEPEFVGTVAADNPQEFLHKVRSGQPGTPMPSALERGWPAQDIVDVLAFAQTLPTGAPEAPAAAPAPVAAAPAPVAAAPAPVAAAPAPVAAPASLPKTGSPGLPMFGLAAAAGLALATVGLVARRAASRRLR